MYDLSEETVEGENHISIQVATTLEREMSAVPDSYGRKVEANCGSGITGMVYLKK